MSIKAKGLEAVERGCLSQAMEAFSSAIVIDPNSQHLYLDMLAQLFLTQEKFFQAVLMCDKAIQFKPGKKDLPDLHIYQS